MKTVLAATLLVTLVAGAASAQTATLKGRFTSKNVTFDIAGGIAFIGKSSLDSETPVILVAVTNTGLNTDEVANFVDRKRALERLVKDDETPIVYLEFSPDGRWRGLSYYFASGNGCAYCMSEVASTVKLAGGRLTGTLTGTEKDRPFTVTLDVPLLADDHGAALSRGNLEVYTRAEKENNLAAYVEYLADKHLVKSVKIVKGWANATKASLLVEGESELGKIAGEVFLVNTNNVWGVDEELVDLVLFK